MKEVTVVYQDCALCGAKGRQTIAEYVKRGIELRKVSFISDEGRKLCAEAVKRGIGSMPIYVCNGAFSPTLDGLFNENKEKRKAASKSKKQMKKKGSENGANTAV